LAKPDLIGDQEIAGRRVQHLQNRLELVGVEVGVGGLHAVDHVGQVTSDADMCEDTAEAIRGGKLALREQIDRLLGIRWKGFELTAWNALDAALEMDEADGSTGTRFYRLEQPEA
ncbi:MAG: hypothetical protein ACREDL_16135, partial [Bradyrhizobium sp.]